MLRKRTAHTNTQLLASPATVTHKGNCKMSSLFPMDPQSYIHIIPMCQPHGASFCSHFICSNSGERFLWSQIRTLRYVRFLPLFPLPAPRSTLSQNPIHFTSISVFLWHQGSVSLFVLMLPITPVQGSDLC